MHISHSPILLSHYESQEKYEEALELAEEFVMSSLRLFRNQLLTSSDWTQLPDSALNEQKRSEWAQYRAALRDFPSTLSLDYSQPFLLDASVFPVKPE